MTQIGMKCWYVLKIHNRSDLHTKINHCIQHIIFYRALQKFQCINIFCSFLITLIGTKFWCVFKPHRYDLYTKISYRIQYIFCYRALQKFECINFYCFLLKCTALSRIIDVIKYTDLLNVLKWVNVLHIDFLELKYQRIYKDY